MARQCQMSACWLSGRLVSGVEDWGRFVPEAPSMVIEGATFDMLVKMFSMEDQNEDQRT